VRTRAKVIIGGLQEVVHEESIGTKLNDLDLCLDFRGRLRSHEPLRHIRH